MATATAFAAKIPTVESVPDEMTEKRWSLNVYLAAERPKYMSITASATRINGFKDRDTCWNRAAEIASLLAKAAKDAGDNAGSNFSCEEVTEFLR